MSAAVGAARLAGWLLSGLALSAFCAGKASWICAAVALRFPESCLPSALTHAFVDLGLLVRLV